MIDLTENYDETDPLSIEEYSKELIGKTFEEVLRDYFGDDADSFEEMRKKFNNPYSKGSLGQLIEEYFFGYTPNSSPEPDFSEAGVELKVTPYEKTKTGKIRAGERLVLGMIPNNKPVPETFEESAAYRMLEIILLILYHRDRELERVQYPIHYSQLVSLNSRILEKDLEIIKSDYRIIIDKIKAGKAHELSEADTMYLGAATKGATAKKSYQPQYYNPDIQAKRRAFSLKQGYMSSFIKEYIVEEAETYDVIAEEPVSKESFEDLVISRLREYKGYSEDQLRRKFDLIDSKSKDIYSRLALKILDIDTETAEEFEKSNTEVKTIRLEKDGSVRENMSFSTISFLEFAEEEWEDSHLYRYFSETRFLFVVFRNIDGTYHLEDAMFWHMPIEDLEGPGKRDWLKTQDIIQEGVEFQIRGSRVFNNIPNPSETTIFHLRPKAQLAAYSISKLNLEKGNIERDADKLPSGDSMTRQSFWLNKDYVREQIEKFGKRS